MPETTPLIKAALNLRVGVGFDVYEATKSGIVYGKRLLKVIGNLYLLSQDRQDSCQ